MLNLIPRRPRKARLDVAQEGTRTSCARRTREDISSDGIAFLALMAGKTALAHTSEEFPDLINRLAPHRYQPVFMVSAIAGLVDDLPKRQELPSEVVRELGRLHDLYCKYQGR